MKRRRDEDRGGMKKTQRMDKRREIGERKRERKRNGNG